MERMAAPVEVVDNHFDYIVVTYHMSVGGMTVDDWVRGVFPDTQGCVE